MSPCKPNLHRQPRLGRRLRREPRVRIFSAAENINQLDPRYLSVPRTLLNSNINSPDVVAAGYRPPWAGFSSALGANATLGTVAAPVSAVP